NRAVRVGHVHAAIGTNSETTGIGRCKAGAGQRAPREVDRLYGAGRRRAGQHEDRQYDDRSGDRAESGHGASCTWRTGFRGGSISLEDHKSPRPCGTLAVLAQKKLREARPIVRVGSYSRRCDPPAPAWVDFSAHMELYDAIPSYTLGSGVHRRARAV